jgi:hypothetical protein
LKKKKTAERVEFQFSTVLSEQLLTPFASSLAIRYCLFSAAMASLRKKAKNL